MTVKLLDDLPDNVIGFEAIGEVDDDDYEDVILPAVERLLGDHDAVRILYVMGEDFDKYEADAMWEDTKMGMHYRGKWERIAVVTDHKGYQRSIKAFGFLMPGDVKVYPMAQLADAKAWIGS
ncbi:MAG: STAS/SEC14 domain-containing protein [Acidimicrobiia bacterium]|nr:STAS/SEC14 domain-containing protein [Acidimicrobiia bacterium]